MRFPFARMLYNQGVILIRVQRLTLAPSATKFSDPSFIKISRRGIFHENRQSLEGFGVLCYPRDVVPVLC